jgi:hypothetical protein
VVLDVIDPQPVREATLAEVMRLLPCRRPDAWSERLEVLYGEAVDNFGPRCLWNMKSHKTLDGMLVIATRLRKHAGMDAWRLAAKIIQEIAVAAR